MDDSSIFLSKYEKEKMEPVMSFHVDNVFMDSIMEAFKKHLRKYQVEVQHINVQKTQ